MANSVPQVEATSVSSVSEISSIRAKAAPRKQVSDTSATKPVLDTVRLSTASKVLALMQRGVPVTQIAATLGLSVTDVDRAISASASSLSSSQSAVIAAYNASTK